MLQSTITTQMETKKKSNAPGNNENQSTPRRERRRRCQGIIYRHAAATAKIKIKSEKRTPQEMKDPLTRSLERQDKKDSHNQRTRIQYTPIIRQGVISREEREKGVIQTRPKEGKEKKRRRCVILMGTFTHTSLLLLQLRGLATQWSAPVSSLSSPLCSSSPPQSASHPFAR